MKVLSPIMYCTAIFDSPVLLLWLAIILVLIRLLGYLLLCNAQLPHCCSGDNTIYNEEFLRIKSQWTGNISLTYLWSLSDIPKVICTQLFCSGNQSVKFCNNNFWKIGIA